MAIDVFYEDERAQTDRPLNEPQKPLTILDQQWSAVAELAKRADNLAHRYECLAARILDVHTDTTVPTEAVDGRQENETPLHLHDRWVTELQQCLNRLQDSLAELERL